MNRFSKALALVAALWAGLAGVAAAQGQEQANAWLAELRETEVRELSESEMQRLLGAMEEIEGMDGAIDTDTPDMFAAIQANSEARALLSKYDFTPPAFQSAVHNVVLAMGALAMRDQKAEIDQAIAQLSAMKDQLPEAQYKMLEEQVVGTVRLFEKAPAANVALVEKYQSELESLGE